MRNIFLLCLFLFGSILVSCKKDKDDPKPTTGSIRATAIPAGAATNMRLTRDNTTIEIAPNSSGIFQADNLQAGNYSVTFTPAVGFQGPQASNVSVTAGSTNDLGTVAFVQPGSPFIGTMSATVNGNTWNSALHGGTVDGSGMGLTISGAAVSLTGTSETIMLNLPNITGLGTYSAPFDASAVYMVASITGTPQTWVSGSNCTITITNIDQVEQKISGTFSFTASPAPGSSASGNKTVTNGTFTNLVIQ
jgi:hypothetical protein